MAYGVIPMRQPTALGQRAVLSRYSRQQVCHSAYCRGRMQAGSTSAGLMNSCTACLQRAPLYIALHRIAFALFAYLLFEGYIYSSPLPRFCRTPPICASSSERRLLASDCRYDHISHQHTVQRARRHGRSP